MTTSLWHDFSVCAFIFWFVLGILGIVWQFLITKDVEGRVKLFFFFFQKIIHFLLRVMVDDAVSNCHEDQLTVSKCVMSLYKVCERASFVVI